VSALAPAELALLIKRTPVRLSGTPADYARGGPPGLGEHTAEVLTEAGYDESEIDALKASGAVK